MFAKLSRIPRSFSLTPLRGSERLSLNFRGELVALYFSLLS